MSNRRPRSPSEPNSNAAPPKRVQHEGITRAPSLQASLPSSPVTAASSLSSVPSQHERDPPSALSSSSASSQGSSQVSSQGSSTNPVDVVSVPSWCLCGACTEGKQQSEEKAGGADKKGAVTSEHGPCCVTVVANPGQRGGSGCVCTVDSIAHILSHGLGHETYLALPEHHFVRLCDAKPDKQGAGQEAAQLEPSAASGKPARFADCTDKTARYLVFTVLHQMLLELGGWKGQGLSAAARKSSRKRHPACIEAAVRRRWPKP